MTRPPIRILEAERIALFEAARASGRLGRTEDWRTVCQGCGNWVGGIWFVNEQGRRLCRACSPKERA